MKDNPRAEHPRTDPSTLPLAVAPDGYRHHVGRTWHQRGEECIGFAPAAIANSSRRRELDDPRLPSVSRRMLYEVAQLHDDADFQQGSTLRGALKGWSRTGVARDELWPCDPTTSSVPCTGTPRSRDCSTPATGHCSATVASPGSTSRASRTRWHRAMRSRKRCIASMTTAVPTDPLAYAKVLRRQKP